jgi:hypothetical protein
MVTSPAIGAVQGDDVLEPGVPERETIENVHRDGDCESVHAQRPLNISAFFSRIFTH